jgi:NADPH:quinone reductase-like Zn-dependent oxidoreductase
LLAKAIHAEGVYVGSRAMYARLITAFETNHIHPVIERTFPLSQAQEALAWMKSGSHFGKIVLSLRD